MVALVGVAAQVTGCGGGTLRRGVNVGKEPNRLSREVLEPRVVQDDRLLQVNRATPSLEGRVLPTGWQQWLVPTVHHHGVMMGMRLTEIWLWPEPFADTQPTPVAVRYHAAFTRPPKWYTGADWFEWDGDRWWINALGHSLFGSELYLAARRCQFGPLPALAFTAVSSAVWEYGYEASGVRPSALDLVYTPLSGLVLGEVRHWVYREAGHLPDGVFKVLFQGLMDPLGEGERLLGAPC